MRLDRETKGGLTWAHLDSVFAKIDPELKVTQKEGGITLRQLLETVELES